MEFYKIRVLALAEKILCLASVDPCYNNWKRNACLADIQQIKDGSYCFENIVDDARNSVGMSDLRRKLWYQLVNILKFYHHKKS